MQLTTRIPRRRATRTERAAAPAPAPKAPIAGETADARRGGGPEDRALYSCECGFAWTGEVSASPACPHCGTPQAW